MALPPPLRSKLANKLEQHRAVRRPVPQEGPLSPRGCRLVPTGPCSASALRFWLPSFLRYAPAFATSIGLFSGFPFVCRQRCKRRLQPRHNRLLGILSYNPLANNALGQLRKDVVKRDREREVQSVYIHGSSHRPTSRRFVAMFSFAAAACSKDAGMAAGSAAFSHF
jgi:hypothetical protein